MNLTPMNPTDDELPDDTLRRAMAALDVSPVPEGPSEVLLASTLNALASGANESLEVSTRTFSPTFFHGSKRMQRMATAAGVLLAIGLVVALPVAFQSRASAFGEALRQAREARMMSYVQEMKLVGKPDSIVIKEFVAQDGRRRMEQGKVGSEIVSIFEAAGFVRLTLIEATKSALVQDVREQDRLLRIPTKIEWLERLQKQGNMPDKELGKRMLNGREVTGFEVTQSPLTYTMWVDVATNQPAQIEYDLEVNGSKTHITMRDFHFNQELDESLFSIDVPVGYKVRRSEEIPEMRVTGRIVPFNGGEASLLAALKGYTKRADGKFPTSLQDWGPWAVLFSQGKQDAEAQAEMRRVMSHLGSILPFLLKLPMDEYAYLGAGKTTADKEAIIFWYKKPDGIYRAIFGDLSVKDVSREDLPIEGVKTPDP